jgi:hydroxyacylglutathione hydrolase
MLRVTHLKTGRSVLPNFIYFVHDHSSKDVVLVDPGWDHDTLLDSIRRDSLTLRAILLTHADSDHVQGVELITAKTPVPVYMMGTEIEDSGFRTQGLTACAHEQEILAGSIGFTCLHTPGHTRGSACFLVGDFLFTGDTIFIEGCGYCLPPRGSPDAMFDSVNFLSNRVSSDVLVFPAHQYGMEPGVPMHTVRKRNIYFRLKNREAFVSFSERRGLPDFDAWS